MRAEYIIIIIEHYYIHTHAIIKSIDYRYIGTKYANTMHIGEKIRQHFVCA